MNSKFGCLARFSFYPYEYDVEFAKKNNFDFLQIQYDRNGLLQKDISTQAKIIKEIGFPGIIHAALSIDEIEEHTLILVDLLRYLGHKAVIIHPTCKNEKMNKETIFILADKVRFALGKFLNEGVSLYLENNTIKLNPIFASANDIKTMFTTNPELNFVLDIAHMDSYEHLEDVVKQKMPNLLHITDRILEEVHNHVPIGKGNIDFNYIFSNIITNYEGNIIFEIYPNDEDIIYAKRFFENILSTKSNNL